MCSISSLSLFSALMQLKVMWHRILSCSPHPLPLRYSADLYYLGAITLNLSHFSWRSNKMMWEYFQNVKLCTFHQIVPQNMWNTFYKTMKMWNFPFLSLNANKLDEHGSHMGKIEALLNSSSLAFFIIAFRHLSIHWSCPTCSTLTKSNIWLSDWEFVVYIL